MFQFCSYSFHLKIFHVFRNKPLPTELNKVDVSLCFQAWILPPPSIVDKVECLKCHVQSQGKAMNSTNTALYVQPYIIGSFYLRNRLAGSVCSKARRNAHPYSENVNTLGMSVRKCLLWSPLLAVFRVTTLTTYLSSCLTILRFSWPLDSCLLPHHCFVEGAPLITCSMFVTSSFFSCFLSVSSSLLIRYLQLRLRYAHPNFLFFPKTPFDSPDILFILCLFPLGPGVAYS
jgi:hypothetical protein